MTKEELQATILPGDKVLINSPDWFSNGRCIVKRIAFDPKSTQVRIESVDGHSISTAYHFIEKVI